MRQTLPVYEKLCNQVVSKKLDIKIEIQRDYLQEFIKDDSYILTRKNGRYIDNCI